jgi:hypothetical protein
LPYRLRGSRSLLGITVVRTRPTYGRAFDVRQITLVSNTSPAAHAAPTARDASRRSVTSSPQLLIGISANSQGWGANAGKAQDRVAALGIHLIREDFTETGPGTLDRSLWDAVFAAAANRHITVLPVLSNTADYADSDFVAAATSRYGPGGSFWKEHPSLDGDYAPTWWEVGNEPWGHGQSPASYARNFKKAVIAGRAANPNVRFLLSAFSTWKNPATGNWEPWVTPMFAAVHDLSSYIDGWSDHPYCNGEGPGVWDPSSPSWVWEFQQFRKVHDELNAHGAGSAPMWITEFGYPTSGDRSTSEQEQASDMRAAAQMLTNVPYARALIFYQLQDWGPRDGDREHYFGITRADGSAKPAYVAAKEIAAAAN